MTGWFKWQKWRTTYQPQRTPCQRVQPMSAVLFLEHTCISNAIDKNVVARTRTLIFLATIPDHDTRGRGVILFFFLARDARLIARSTPNFAYALRPEGTSGEIHDTRVYHCRCERMLITSRWKGWVFIHSPNAPCESDPARRLRASGLAVVGKRSFLRASHRRPRVYVGCNGVALQGPRRHGVTLGRRFHANTGLSRTAPVLFRTSSLVSETGNYFAAFADARRSLAGGNNSAMNLLRLATERPSNLTANPRDWNSKKRPLKSAEEERTFLNARSRYLRQNGPFSVTSGDYLRWLCKRYCIAQIWEAIYE